LNELQRQNILYLLKISKILKDIFIKYKSVIRFVVLFLGSYLLLSVLYSFYLKVSINSGYFPDYFTNLVARQSAAILETLGYNTILFENHAREGVYLTIKETSTVNIVEGCNSISVIILFVSFVIAFAEKFKKTFLFLLVGMVLVYVVNLIRISILVVALYKYPQHQEVLHSVVFPAIIYGMVFLLWIAWVRMLNPKSEE